MKGYLNPIIVLVTVLCCLFSFASADCGWRVLDNGKSISPAKVSNESQTYLIIGEDYKGIQKVIRALEKNRSGFVTVKVLYALNMATVIASGDDLRWLCNQERLANKVKAVEADQKVGLIYLNLKKGTRLL